MGERIYRINNLGCGFELKYGLLGSLGAGEKIVDGELTIGFVSNGRLLPRRFNLRPRDHNPIVIHNEEDQLVYRLDYPGKSAFLLFEDSIDRRMVGDMVEVALNRPINRRDKLHIATVGDIELAGWRAYWAPLPGDNFLHTRLVPNSVMSNMSFNSQEAKLLCPVFSKAC